MKNKIITIVLSILIIVLTLILVFTLHNPKFNKPNFDNNAVYNENILNKYSSSKMKINNDYSFYINGNPKYNKNKLNVDFVSYSSDNVNIKIRVLCDNEICGESGLIKSNQYLENIKVNKKIKKSKKVSFIIMSYENKTYYSLGEVVLNIKVK